ncbi:hypothetical protein NN561_005365 [Cricetulus griseus]
MRAPAAPAPRLRGACAGRGRRGGGWRAGRGPAIPQLAARSVGCQIGVGWGAALRQEAQASYPTSVVSSLPQSVRPGRRLAALQPGEHGAPPEDFGQAPRPDKGVGDGDTSVTAARGRGGGEEEEDALLQAPRPERSGSFAGAQGRGGRRPSLAVLWASLKPPRSVFPRALSPLPLARALTEDHWPGHFLALSSPGPAVLPRSARRAAQVCHRAGAEAASAPTPEITW